MNETQINDLLYVAKSIKEMKEENDKFINEFGMKLEKEFVIHSAKMIGRIDGLMFALRNIDL
jgi:hypothetical protein